MQECTEQSTSRKLVKCRPHHAPDSWEACLQNQNVISMHSSVQTCSQLLHANSQDTLSLFPQFQFDIKLLAAGNVEFGTGFQAGSIDTGSPF